MPRPVCWICFGARRVPVSRFFLVLDAVTMTWSHVSIETTRKKRCPGCDGNGVSERARREMANAG